MKFLHLGDLHLGRSLSDFDLIEDQQYMLDQVLGLLRETKADAVLIAGDIYDKSVPSEAAVRLLDHFLVKLADMQIEAFLISGNHDSDDRLQFGSSFFETRGIHICSRFEGELKSYTFTDEYGPVHIWMLPYVKASRVRHYYPDADIVSYEDAVRTVLEHADIDYSARNILIAHQFVAGREDPVLAGSEGASVQSVGLVEKISAGIFMDFDYVALGHIHSPQRAGAEHIRYAGSMLKYSLSEAANDKSAVLVTLGEKGAAGKAGEAAEARGAADACDMAKQQTAVTQIELLPLHPRRDLRRLKGPLKELLDSKNVTDTDDYIYATLTDEDIINDVMGIFRQYYPNTVRIDYDNAHTREAVLEASGKEAESRTFAELISDFYRQIYGCEISEEELGVMQEAAAAAGVAGAGGDTDTGMAGPLGRGPEGRDISGGSSNHTGLVKEEGRQDS